MQRRQGENLLNYAKRLVQGKQEGIYDIDYIEIWKLLFSVELSSDEARKRIYGLRQLFENVDTDLEQNLSDNSLDELETKKQELFKEKVKVQDQRREYRNLLRQDARFEHLKEEIQKNAEKIAKEKHIEFTPPTNINSDKEAALILSDWHFGLAIENYWNCFNKDIFDERINKLVQKTIEYGQQHNIKTLHTFLIGDLISGLIRIKTKVANEEDIVQQVQYVSEVLAEILTEFSKHFEVKVYTVLGNHDRITPQKEEEISKESFLKFIPWYLQTRLSNISNIYIDDNYIDDEIITADVCGNKIVGVHGHRDGINNVVQNLSLMLKQIPNYVLCGHVHKSASNETHGVEVIVNPSLSGVDDYAKEIRRTSKPAQKFLVFERDEGLLCTYSIRLD